MLTYLVFDFLSNIPIFEKYPTAITFLFIFYFFIMGVLSVVFFLRKKYIILSVILTTLVYQLIEIILLADMIVAR